MTATIPSAGTSGVEPATAGRLAEGLVAWLADGVRRDELFAPDVFLDLSLPHWRVQADSREEMYGVREADHAGSSELRVELLEPTPSGFVVALEERWEHGGQRWYCREMLHGRVRDGRISEVRVACTGDWDEATQRRHAAQVRLLRP